MPRAITIIGLLQTLMIVIGFFALGIVLKGCGYPTDDPGIRWNPLAVMLREHGLLLLAIPMIWTLYAVASHRRDAGLASSPVVLAIGGALAVLLIGSFLYALLRPFTRPVLFWLGN